MPDPGHGSTQKTYSRALEIGLNSLKFQEQDGGLLIKDVPLLAEGTWTDSNVGTPARYRGEILEQFATAWRDQSIWSRHAGGVPRNITEKIGTVIDPHYQDRAVMGDVFLHGQNTQSRDTLAMVKAGLAEFVSVEHIGAEVWDPGESVYDVVSLEFLGLAIVNKGACKKCRLNEEDQENGVQKKELEEDDMDPKELEEMKGQYKALSEALAKSEGERKELAEQIGKLEAARKADEEKLKQLAGLEARVKELEESPGDPKANLGDGKEKELAEPDTPYIVVRNGVMMRED